MVKLPEDLEWRRSFEVVAVAMKLRECKKWQNIPRLKAACKIEGKQHPTMKKSNLVLLNLSPLGLSTGASKGFR